MHLIHRGIVSKKYHENLLKSFEQSFKKGFGIETDIHATKDNEFICFHDFTLTRIFKRKESVKNLSYFKIKNISEKQKKPVPLLKDLLKSSKNRYFLFIEIKPTFSINQLKKLLNETKKYKKCVFISFKHENIFFGGDSAGGNLSLVCTLKLQELKYKLPSKLFLLSPWTDLTGEGRSIKENSKSDPYLSYDNFLFFKRKNVTLKEKRNVLLYE